MAWFPKEVDLTWIHISFVYVNIYLSFYFEGPHSNFRYILVALKKDGNNVHFFDVLPHCGVCTTCREKQYPRVTVRKIFLIEEFKLNIFISGGS